MPTSHTLYLVCSPALWKNIDKPPPSLRAQKQLLCPLEIFSLESVLEVPSAVFHSRSPQNIPELSAHKRHSTHVSEIKEYVARWENAWVSPDFNLPTLSS